MSFFTKLRTGAAPSGQSTNNALKKDPNAPQPTALEKQIADIVGPPRLDGSDKFFGIENYGSTCYCNSILQCLYYSEPFREHLISFPSKALLEHVQNDHSNGASTQPRLTSTTPYPNVTSPARKVMAPNSPGPGAIKPEESKDSPEYKKRMALQAGPVLGMTHDNSGKYGMEESLFTALRDMFDSVIENQSRTGVVSPHRFLEILRRDNEMFRSAMHQDAHEFLNYLLNQVGEQVESFLKKSSFPQGGFANGSLSGSLSSSYASLAKDGILARSINPNAHWVRDIFEGTLTSETRCLTCETTSQRDEPFLDLSVDTSAHTSVTACLRKFSEEEMLCERNKFHCDTCGGLQEAEKRMKIKRLPRVLALHLKRFRYADEQYVKLQKLFHRVSYPYHLRLFNTTEDTEDTDRIYELASVVVHIGGGPYHGHYVAITKTKELGWVLFDDEHAEPVDKSYVMNFFGGEIVPGADNRQLANAYVLFYQQTTEEAVLAEQEAEAQEKSARASDAETAKDDISPTKHMNGLHHIVTATSPSREEMDHMDALAHAATAPAVGEPHPERPRFDHHPTSPLMPASPVKSKKELKQEEKDRKAAQKAEEKAQVKALEDKRKEISAKRLELLRKAEEEMTRPAASEEPKKRVDEAPVKEKESGLARFRHGSMSIRGKQRLFGKDKDKEKEKEKSFAPTISSSSTEDSSALEASVTGDSSESSLPSQPASLASTPASEIQSRKSRLNPFGNSKDKPPATPTENYASTSTAAVPHTTVGDPAAQHEAIVDGTPTALPTLPNHNVAAVTATEEKVKRNRFSLGRKKSTAFI